MRWPWQRSRGRHAALPVQRRASWAQPAVPPTAETASPLASPVRLGFVDGSELELTASDPNALALRAVADLLVQDRPRGADN